MAHDVTESEMPPIGYLKITLCSNAMKVEANAM